MVADHQLQRTVLLAQAGDRAALDAVFQAMQVPLHRYLAGIAGREAADDLLQDTFVLMYRKLRWLRDPALLRPWAYRIASRVAFRWLKRNKRWREEELTEEVALTEPQSGADHETLAAVMTRLDELSAKSRAVIVMRYLEEMSFEEIAAVLDVPLGTVKSRLAYGLSALRK